MYLIIINEAMRYLPEEEEIEDESEPDHLKMYRR